MRLASLNKASTETNMRLQTLAAIAGLLSQTACAAPVTTDPGSAPAGAYKLDATHARLTWQISHLGVSTYTGWFTKFDMSLGFDPAAPEKSAFDAIVDAASIHTLDPKFDAQIAGDEFLEAAKYPQVSFHSATITRTGPTTGVLNGEMRLHGVAKPVSFNVTFTGTMVNPMSKHRILGFHAEGKLKRSDFGITRYLEFGLGDEITIIFDGEFEHRKE